jgi:tetratricopeptide (TPR) repeat protein
MKKHCILLAGFLFICLLSDAQQKSTVKEYRKIFKTYPFSDPDPVPEMGKIYPYFRFDGYTDNAIQKEWKVVELENDYIKVMILPEIGGKIWAAIEKSTGKSFIYYNHVVKFRDVAMRGPWTSGGIEPNYGIIGHTPNCATPVDYVTIKKPDGSVSCVIGVLDLLTRTSWKIDINLPKDKAYFSTSSFWYNASPFEQPYYTWMNTGIKANGNLQFVYPGTKYLGHAGEYSDWPINKKNDKDISWYKNNDFGGYKSYHVFGKYTGFFGGYWHDDDFGMGRYSTHDDKAGKKLWIWGLSQQGMIWEKLLTDTDGQYTEVQSGRLFNQSDDPSTFTPFKHKGFLPHTSDVWTEYWFPVVKTKGFVAANNYGALNIKKENDWLKIYFSPLQKTDDELKITVGDKTIYTRVLHLNTLQLFADSIKLDLSVENLMATLGKNKLEYDASPAANVLSRPVQTPADFDWNSAYGLYIQGKENIRERNYAGAENKLKSALQKDSNYLPALADMSMLMYRNMRYDEALDFAKKALSIDTYDGAANYYYGLINVKKGMITDAKDGFDIAASNIEYRSAAYTELATLYFRQNNFERSIDYANKAIDFNRYAVDAYQLLAVNYRLQNDKVKEGKVLNTILNFDPLNHFARFEKYLLDGSTENKTEFTGLITNELPQQTYLELAIWYYSAGRNEDALKVLQLSPGNAEIAYWKAFLENKPVNEEQLNPEMVFPFRNETAEILQQLILHNDNWVLKYHLALIEWNDNNETAAKKLFDECGKPKHAPFYAARAALNKNINPEKELEDLQSAIALDPAQWRYARSLIVFYLSHNQIVNAVNLAATYHSKLPGNYLIGMLYAKTLLENNQYKDALIQLQKINILPNEGTTEGRQLYKEALLMLALEEMKKGKYKEALNYISLARLWPENLGVGKPYGEDIDERLQDWLSYQNYVHLKDESSAQQMLDKIISFDKAREAYPSANSLVTAWALEKTGNPDQAQTYLQQLLHKNPDNVWAQWTMNTYNRKAFKLPDTKAPDENYMVLKNLVEG